MSRPKPICLYCQLEVADNYSNAATSNSKRKYWDNIRYFRNREIIQRSAGALHECSPEHREKMLLIRRVYRAIHLNHYKSRLDSMLLAFRRKLEAEKNLTRLRQLHIENPDHLSVRLAKAEASRVNSLFAQRKRRLAELSPQHDEIQRLLDRQIDALTRIAMETYNKDGVRLDTAPSN